MDIPMKYDKLYQYLFDYALGIRTSDIPKFRSLCFRLYSYIIFFHKHRKITNEYIKYQLGGKEMVLSTVHRLPFTLTFNPLYSSNLPRICRYVAQKYPDLSIVDIGANVGDTAFLIKKNVDAPMLCIEGNNEYSELLNLNVRQFHDVETEICFVREDGLVYAELATDGRGTARIAKLGDTSSSSQLIFRSLESIVGRHPKFRSFKILKIDTDGYDCQIIRKNAEIISTNKPVIFFEYAPAWLPDGKDSELCIFEFLKEMGYHGVMFYTGEGDLLYSCTLDDDWAVKQIHEYFARGSRFGDFAVFPAVDKNLYEQILSAENAFFRNFFG